MVVIPPQHIYMQRDARVLRPAAQAMLHHLGVQLAHHGGLEAEVTDEEGARGDVEDGAGKGFVEGRVGVAEAGDARARAQRGGEGGAEGEERVFGCVVVVDCHGYQHLPCFHR